MLNFDQINRHIHEIKMDSEYLFCTNIKEERLTGEQTSWKSGKNWKIAPKFKLKIEKC